MAIKKEFDNSKCLAAYADTDFGPRGWTKKKFTDIFKSGGNILGQCASKALK